MKIDYWSCPYCGTDYGPDQAECVHTECREADEAANRDMDSEDYGRQEKRLTEDEIRGAFAWEVNQHTIAR
jgi:hypothetical protein